MENSENRIDSRHAGQHLDGHADQPGNKPDHSAPEPHYETQKRTCLPNHGPFEARREIDGNWAGPWSSCPQCTAWYEAEQAEIAAREQARLAAEQARRRQQQRDDAGLPARFENASLDNFEARSDEQQAALAACRELVAALQGQAPAPNLLLLGHPGTGKTHLACALINALLPAQRVRRRQLPQIIRELRASWQDRQAPGEAEVIRLYGRLDLLIVEEIGLGSGTEAELNALFEIMDERYEARLPTVLTSNFGLARVREVLGERITDRLREDRHHVLALSGSSWRGGA